MAARVTLGPLLSEANISGQKKITGIFKVSGSCPEDIDEVEKSFEESLLNFSKDNNNLSLLRYNQLSKPTPTQRVVNSTSCAI